MSDGVVVALITVAGSIIVAVITTLLSHKKPTIQPQLHLTVAETRRDKHESLQVTDGPDPIYAEAINQIPSVDERSEHKLYHSAPSASSGIGEPAMDKPTSQLEALQRKWPIFLDNGRAIFSDFQTLPNLYAIIEDGKNYVTNATVTGSDWKDRHLEPFHKLERLEKLNLVLCERLRDESLVFISRCRSLRELDFRGLSGEASKRFTGAGLRQLAKLTHLELLRLPYLFNERDPSVKDAIRYLKVQLPNCVIQCPGLSL